MPPDSAPRPVSRRGLYITAISAAVIAVVIVVLGITSRKIADAKLQEWTENQAIPVVAVAPPETRGKTSTFSLPGRLEAYVQAQIYARVTGYVKEWEADIGTPVKAGQLLATIDAPDLDQQIMQAEANLASAKANSVLSDMTLTRGQSLIKTLAISQQDLDQRAADAVQQAGAGPRGASQSRSPARTGTVQAAHRAVRRARHLAHHRRRRADQRRRRRAADVRRLGHEQIARLRQCAAKLCAQHPGRHQGADRPCRNIRDGLSRRPSRRPHNPSRSRRARRACSSLSTIPTMS